MMKTNQVTIMRFMCDGVQAPAAPPPESREAKTHRRLRRYAEFRCDGATQIALQTLLETVCEDRPMQHASEQIQEVWESLSEEKKDRLRMDFDASRWQLVAPFPLAEKGVNRVVRLRGYGNAINAEVARVFIESTQEV